MKKIIWITITAVFVTSCHSQNNDEQPWKAVVKVVNESGKPMEGTDVTIGYYVQPPEGQTIATSSTKGKTDANGSFSATGKTRSTDLFLGAGKDGYYRSHYDYELGLPMTYDPAKWNIEKTLVLKKIGRPAAMYAKHILQLKIPEFNKAIGFDLMIGDWVGPYGKGVNADLLFTQHHTNPQSGYPITLSFPNSGDGIQEFALQESDKGSGLRSGHEAPSDGYQATIAQTVMTNPNRNFYFRVRTKLDENGKIVSARYGKIYGDLAQFTYYYNPTPNDRNIEFDPKQNLLGGLKSFESVSAP